MPFGGNCIIKINASANFTQISDADNADWTDLRRFLLLMPLAQELCDLRKSCCRRRNGSVNLRHLRANNNFHHTVSFGVSNMSLYRSPFTQKMPLQGKDISSPARLIL